MDLNHLHFAQPLWLWGGLAIPLVWAAFFFFNRKQRAHHQLEKFIDSHLLPYLLINKTEDKHSSWKRLLLWSAVWCCLILALAGPRWHFREIETFSRDQSLVILLDLSESMNATDIKPSRLIRAKQKIEDLVNLSKGVKIGLIAFAADPHMIFPLTDDKQTILHLLPSLDTSLVYVQGSRLSPALDMASTMLETEGGHNHALLLISDGGFEDATAITTAKQLEKKGVVIHAMGIGTVEGAPLQDHEGNIIKKNGSPIISKLEKERLSEISKAGHGSYLEARYTDHDEAVILNELEKRADTQLESGKKNRLWDEHFYLFILPVLPILLWWFRRGYVLAMILILFAPVFNLKADIATDYFKNSEERGEQALRDGDYETAINTFQDPYRKGVANYKAGHFAEAEKMFRESSRDEVACSAMYNLGNALVQQQKLQEAVQAYEDALKRYPEHKHAKENLELVKKMLEQQKQQNPDSDNSNQQEDKDQKNQSENKDKNETQDSKENSDKDQQQQNNNKPEEQKEEQEAKAAKSQKDQDADMWLNQLSDEPKEFLKNKFTIESKKNGTKEGIDPW